MPFSALDFCDFAAERLVSEHHDLIRPVGRPGSRPAPTCSRRPRTTSATRTCRRPSRSEVADDFSNSCELRVASCEQSQDESSPISPLATRHSPLEERFHPHRAPGGDPDHPAGQRRGAADRAAGVQPPPGERGRADPPGRAGRRPRSRPSTRTSRPASACCPTRPTRSPGTRPLTRSIPTRSWPTTGSSRSTPRRNIRRATARRSSPGLRVAPPTWGRRGHADDPAFTPARYPIPTCGPDSHGEPILFERANAGFPQPADILVLEHPGRRQDPAQQRRPLVHGHRPDGWSARAPAATRELFVNVGPPAPIGQYTNRCPTAVPGQSQPVEYLLLVNGQDDNKNGWVDEGYDGVNNNGVNGVRRHRRVGARNPGWARSSTHTSSDIPYTIRRRPAPSPACPRGVAAHVDGRRRHASWAPSDQERSRLPVNPFTGYVDIMLNPDGTVVPTDHVQLALVVRHGRRVLPLLAGRAQDLMRPPAELERHRGPAAGHGRTVLACRSPSRAGAAPARTLGLISRASTAVLTPLRPHRADRGQPGRAVLLRFHDRIQQPDRHLQPHQSVHPGGAGVERRWAMIRKSVVSGQWSVVSESGRAAQRARAASGITLTEILIAIMILGVGLVSLATLFPIGLLRLRDATRYTRSATLLQTAAVRRRRARAVQQPVVPLCGQSQLPTVNNRAALLVRHAECGPSYNPLTQDTPFYGGDWATPVRTGDRYWGPRDPCPSSVDRTPIASGASGPGLPFAYDPLWRYQTLSANRHTAAGLLFPWDDRGLRGPVRLRARRPSGRTPTHDGDPPSAHGLQRITNFNRPYVLTENA